MAPETPTNRPGDGLARNGGRQLTSSGPGLRLVGLVAVVVLVALLAAVLVRLAGSAGMSTRSAVIPTPTPTPISGPSAIGVVTYETLAHHTHVFLLTTDAGAHWRDVAPTGVPAGGTLRGFFLNARDGWAAWAGPGRQTPWLYRTHDGGNSWRSSPLPTSPLFPYEINDISFFDAQHGWMTAMGGGIDNFTLLSTTSDGGTTWTQYHSPPSGTALVTPTTGFSIVSTFSESPTAGFGYIMTRDGGRTWRPVVLPGVAYIASTAITLPVFFDPQDGLVGAAMPHKDAIFATHDGGVTWRLAYQQTTHIQTPDYSPAIATFGASLAWDWAPDTDSILRSDDGGRTWMSIPLPSELQNLATWQFASARVGWASTVDAKDNWAILRTTDGGASWQQVYHS